jgi:hypothetical protein
MPSKNHHADSIPSVRVIGTTGDEEIYLASTSLQEIAVNVDYGTSGRTARTTSASLLA